MKSQLLLLTIIVAAFSSCTTAYKTGQTPDDVYYSPLPKQEEYVKQEREDDRRYDEEYYDDRYLRMKVRNRYQWNDLNNWYYYERWGFGHNYYWGSYYNPYNSWNYYYNPYCQQSGIYYSDPKTTAYKPVVKPRTFNLGTYTNTGYNTNNTNTNSKGITRTISTRPVYSNTNNSNNSGTRNSNPKGLGNTVRTIFSGNESNNSGSSGSRTYTPGNNSSSSSSGSSSSGGSSSGGSSGGGVSRPTRN